MKKVEKDLQSGKSVREFTVQAEAEKQKERMVSQQCGLHAAGVRVYCVWGGACCF